jgi:hypothetical protein
MEVKPNETVKPKAGDANSSEGLLCRSTETGHDKRKKKKAW